MTTKDSRLRTITTGLIILALLFHPIVLPTAAESETPPGISVDVSVPESVTAGDSTEIGAAIEVADVPGDHSVEVSYSIIIDGETVDDGTVTIQDGGTGEISTQFAFPDSGTHDVALEVSGAILGEEISASASTTVSVSPEPLGSLGLDASIPSSSTAGESTSISTTVSLPDAAGADYSGDVTVSVQADGERKASETITLTDGQEEEVSLSPTFETGGDTTVTIVAEGSIGETPVSASTSGNIDIQTGSIGELGLSVDGPSSVSAGSTADISATVSVPAIAGQDVNEEITVEVIEDGSVLASNSISLADGASDTVTLSPTFDTAGDHSLTIRVSGTIAGADRSIERSTTISVEAGSIPDPTISVDAPESIQSGEPTTMSATISVPEVTGLDAETALDVTVQANGETKAEESITLGLGDTETIDLEPTFEATGDVSVEFSVSGTIDGTPVSTSISREFTVNGTQSLSGELGGSVDIPRTATVNNQTTMEAELTLPTPPQRASGDLTIELVADGETVVTEQVSLSESEVDSGTTDVELATAFEQSGDVELQLRVDGEVAGLPVSWDSEPRTITIEDQRTSQVSVEGAVFPVPESLEDKASGLTELPGVDDQFQAFVLANQDSMYIVLSDSGSVPSAGAATVSGRTLDRNPTESGMEFGAILATEVTHRTEGAEASVSEINANPDEYRLDLVRVSATYRRASFLTDPDTGSDFTMVETVGSLVENPRSASELMTDIGGNARLLSRYPNATTVDRITGSASREHLNTVGFEEKYWMDSQATVDGVVLNPSGAAYEYAATFGNESVLDTQDGSPILYVADTSLDTQQIDSVDEVSRRATELDGTIVEVEGRVYQSILSTQESLEHAESSCSVDVVTIPTPSGPVCYNINQDAAIQGGVLWDTVPTSREDVLFIAGVSSLHQDMPTTTANGSYTITGEVVSTSRFDSDLPDGSVLLVYRMNRVGGIDYEEVGDEGRSVIEEQTGQLRAMLRAQIGGSVIESTESGESGANESATTHGQVGEVASISPENPVTVEFDEQTATHPVQAITLSVSETITDVEVETTAVDGLPSSVSSPPVESMHSVRIETSADDASIQTATLEFAIPVTENTDPGNFVVYRYHEGSWESLETSVESVSDAEVVLSSETPGFSYFVVGSTRESPGSTSTAEASEETTSGADADEPKTDDVSESTGTTIATDSTGTRNSESTSTDSSGGQPGFGLVLAVLSLSMYLGWRIRK